MQIQERVPQAKHAFVNLPDRKRLRQLWQIRARTDHQRANSLGAQNTYELY
jgi:hypothetical protein